MKADPQSSSQPNQQQQQQQPVYMMPVPQQQQPVYMMPAPQQQSQQAYAMPAPQQQVPPQVQSQQPQPLVYDSLSKQDLVAMILQRQYSVEIEKWIKGGMRLYAKHWLVFSAWTLVYFLMFCLLLVDVPGVQCISWIAIIIFEIIYFSGLIRIGFNMISTPTNNEVSVLGTICSMRHICFRVLILAIACKLLISIGYLFLIIPGVYLHVALSFALHLMVAYQDHGFSIGDYITISRKLVHKNWFSIALYLICMCAINFVSALSVIGLLVSVPLTILSTCCAFVDIFGMPKGYLVGAPVSGESHFLNQDHLTVPVQTPVSSQPQQSNIN